LELPAIISRAAGFNRFSAQATTPPIGNDHQPNPHCDRDPAVNRPLNLSRHEAPRQYVDALQNPDGPHENQECASGTQSGFHVWLRFSHFSRAVLCAQRSPGCANFARHSCDSSFAAAEHTAASIQYPPQVRHCFNYCVDFTVRQLLLTSNLHAGMEEFGHGQRFENPALLRQQMYAAPDPVGNVRSRS
jgi:hypothetical protein